MKTGKRYEIIKIFLSSPADVMAERESVKKVVNKLNQSGQIAEKLGFKLEVLDWSTLAVGMGNPEDVIIEQMPVEEWDIFVGILWVRFGTPTGNEDSKTGMPFLGGTEEEFNLAYTEWEKNKRPHIFFYRCIRPCPPNEIDPDELKRIKKFFDNFEQDGSYPGLYCKFGETSQFEEFFRGHLINHLKRVISKSNILIKNEIYERHQLKPTFISKELNSGETYDIALLNIEIYNFSGLISIF
jgi:hypothetical protein